MTVPYSFANATVSIPLSQLDSNFNTPITLGNTAIQLGNTVTTLNNMTLANVTISSGNVTITNVSVTTANVTTANITNMVSGNVTITGGSINGTTLGATTASTANVTTLTTSSTVTINGGTANGVAFLDGSKVLTTGSALTFDGTYFTVGASATTGDYKAFIQKAGGELLGLNASSGTLTRIAFGNSTASFGSTQIIANGADLAFITNSAEQMRLTSTSLYTASGINVGIGTSSPTRKLQVSSSLSTTGNEEVVYFGGANAVSAGGLSITNYFETGTATSANRRVDLQSKDKDGNLRDMVLQPSGGNLGIGTSSPSTALDVASSNSGITLTNTGASNKKWRVGGNAAASFVITESGVADRMFIDASGNLGLGVTPSAWGGNYKTIQLTGGSVSSYLTGYIATYQNAYDAGIGDFRYVSNNFATRYQQGDGNHQWFIAPSGTAGDPISFTQAMTLDASGNLLVGTTTSATRNITVGTTNASIALAGANGGLYFGAAGTPVGSGGFGVNAAIARAGGANFHITGSADGDLCIAPEGTKAILFGTSASANSVTERARITSGGDLLVGTTSGNSRITAAYSSTNTFGILSENAADNPGVDGAAVIGNLSSSTGTNNTTAVIFRGRSAGADRFYVYGNGNVQNTNNSYGAISDVKLKENITDATPKLENLNRLRVVNYNLKGDTLKQIGLIAQDVEQVFPGLVDSTPDVDPDTKEPTGEVTKSVKYSVLVPMLLKAVQELTVMNDDLRARVAQLEAK